MDDAQGDCSASVGIGLPRVVGSTRNETLPIELLERIFEFVGDIAHFSEGEPVDFPDDETLYPEIPRERHQDVPSRQGPTAYDYLRASALVSRAFTAPAQRALFRVSKTRSSIGLLRLLRSLLEYPANRKSVQWLVTSPLRRENYLDRQGLRWNPPDILDPISGLIQILGPLLHTPALDQVQNSAIIRRFLLFSVAILPDSVNSDTPPKEGQTTSTEAWPPRSNIMAVAGDHILRAILELCPQVRGLRLFDGNTWYGYEHGPSDQEVFSHPPNGPLGQDCYNLKSLTLDIGALKWSLLRLHDHPRYERGYPGGCPPNVEYLKIVRNDTYRFDISLDDLERWLSTNKKLGELRVIHEHLWLPGWGGWDSNWNTILPMFEDTLEVLIMHGNFYFEGMEYFGNRFGDSGMLDCLPQLKKLVDLKVPLHYLRDDSPKFERETEDLGLSTNGRQMNDVVHELRLLHVYHQQDKYEEEDRPKWYDDLVGIRILDPNDRDSNGYHNIGGLIQDKLPPSLKRLAVHFVEESRDKEEGYKWWVESEVDFML